MLDSCSQLSCQQSRLNSGYLGTYLPIYFQIFSMISHSFYFLRLGSFLRVKDSLLGTSWHWDLASQMKDPMGLLVWAWHKYHRVIPTRLSNGCRLRVSKQYSIKIKKINVSYHLLRDQPFFSHFCPMAVTDAVSNVFSR